MTSLQAARHQPTHLHTKGICHSEDSKDAGTRKEDQNTYFKISQMVTEKYNDSINM
jgi:hypothetical protein